MTQPAWITTVEIALCVGSFAIWAMLALRLRSAGEALPYEPRRRVPWSGGVGGVALAFVILSILGAIANRPAVFTGEAPQLPSESLFVSTLLQSSVTQAALVVIGSLWLAAGVAATPHDLGLPRRWRSLSSDVGVGIATALAALAPVYLLQIVLTRLLDWEQPHSTLLVLAEHPTWQVAAAAFLAAAVAAPLFEEFIFRLLFQGWLEKVEDEQLGWSATGREEISAESSERTSAAGEKIAPEGADQSKALSSSESARRELVSFGGLPHGWAPILASSVAFAIVHVDQGPAVAPLFVFAVLLGYVYQRTHRVTPCIIAHAAFNSLSLGLAWAAAVSN